MRRAELVERIRATRAEFEALLAGLSPQQMTQSGVAGDWSVKDMLAHIAWYESEEADFYGGANVEGSPLWRMPQEPRNQALFEQARSRPLEEVVAGFRDAHARLLSVIERLSEEDLATPGRFPGTSLEWPPWRKIAVHSCDHDREHLDTIRAWLEQAR